MELQSVGFDYHAFNSLTEYLIMDSRNLVPESEAGQSVFSWLQLRSKNIFSQSISYFLALIWLGFFNLETIGVS